MKRLVSDEFRHLPGMRFAVVVAAFLIGLVTGVAASPEANYSSEGISQRREIIVNAN